MGHSLSVAAYRATRCLSLSIAETAFICPNRTYILCYSHINARKAPIQLLSDWEHDQIPCHADWHQQSLFLAKVYMLGTD